jgi:3-oxoacyl-[acyl-carrier-protein] synthase II
VTGFYATYEIESDVDRRLFQDLRPQGKLSLRDAFQNCASLTKRSAFNLETASLFSGGQTQKLFRQLQAAKLWSKESELDYGSLTVDPSRVGIVFSTSKGRLLFNHRGDVFNPFTTASDVWATNFARGLNAQGPRLSPVAACATGSHAIAIGAQLIEDGYADVAICGAIEPILQPLVLAAYDNMGALSKSGVMRPFDTKRDGFVPNVGAGCLILENEEKARQRGAQIFGYLSGWAMNADATHMTAMCPSGDSIARAIEYSMRRANVSNIDYINAHGTATKLNDETEAHGIQSALGNKVPVSSTKPLTGHLLGAAGAVEAVISLLALRENFAPPNLNLEEADSECDLDLVVGKGRNLEMKSVLSLNYGFGGHIGALLFEKASE